MQREPSRRRGRPPLSQGASSFTRILEAALDLFSRQGYEGTTLKQIAGQLGLRDTAIYGHFASKAAIRDELVRNFGPNAVRAQWQALDLSQARRDPCEFMRSFVVQLAERWMDPRERQFFRFMLIENLQGNHGNVVDIKEAQAQMRVDLKRFAEHLIEAGVLRDLDRDWLVGQFQGPILALRIEVAFSAAEPDLAQIKARLVRHVDLFFDAFRASH